MKSEKDITLLVDRTFDPNEHDTAKNTTLIRVPDPSPMPRRALDNGNFHRILTIGKNFDPRNAHYEFAGLMLFSKEGFNWFRTAYIKALETYESQPFHEAPRVRKASFTDILQELIKRDYEVYCLEVTSGWMEIHSFDDYKQACNLLARR